MTTPAPGPATGTGNRVPAPVLFVGHGAPTLPFEAVPARAALQALGSELAAAAPRAILLVTAHWETDIPTFGTARRPATVHDFHGFPDALYRLSYPAAGAPEVAEEAVALLRRAGLPAATDRHRGLDHGVWSPLLVMLPDAAIPVVPMSVQPDRDAAHHRAVGRALAPLAGSGVAVIGSGAVVHDLPGRARLADAPAAPHAEAFEAWVTAAVEAGAADRLDRFREAGPQAHRAHPTPEHFLPLLVALGAGGGRGVAIHRSTTYGTVGMTQYRMQPSAVNESSPATSS